MNSKIGFVFFQPANGYWYDISTETKLNMVIDELKQKIEDYVIPLTKRFEDDYCSAIAYLSSDDIQESYSLKKFDAFEKMKTL